MKRPIATWLKLRNELVAAEKAGKPDAASHAALDALNEALPLMLKAWGEEATAGFLFGLAASFAKGKTRGPKPGEARTYHTRALAAVFWEARPLFPTDHACALEMAKALHAKRIGHSVDAVKKAITRAAEQHSPRNALARMASAAAPRAGRKPRLDEFPAKIKSNAGGFPRVY